MKLQNVKLNAPITLFTMLCVYVHTYDVRHIFILFSFSVRCTYLQVHTYIHMAGRNPKKKKPPRKVTTRLEK